MESQKAPEPEVKDSEGIFPSERPDKDRYNKCACCGLEIKVPAEFECKYHQSYYHYCCMRKEQVADSRAKAGAAAMQEAEKTREEYVGSIIKDSGKRESFVTGAVRDIRVGKGRYDLLYPGFFKQLAVHVEQGAVKYADRNWEKGMPIGRTLDSCIRHLLQWQEGDREENHLAAAACNIMFLMFYIDQINKGQLPKELDDNHYIKESK